MRVDPDKSEFHEDPQARDDFTAEELRHCRLLLRRLRFLETQVKENGGHEAIDASGGAMFAVWESAALEWALTELDFLIKREPVKS